MKSKGQFGMIWKKKNMSGAALTILCLTGLVRTAYGQQAEVTPYHLKRLFPPFFGPEDYATLPQPQGWTCNVMRFQAVLTLWGPQCNEVPKNGTDIKITTDMSVYATSMRVLPKGAFSEWQALQRLEIRANNNLTEVVPGAFSGLLLLEEIDFEENQQLQIFPADALSGLSSLRIIRFLKNNIIRISDIAPALRPTMLPAIRVLDFSDNYIPAIEANDFGTMAGTTLEHLYIENTQTTSVASGAFAYLGNLTTLCLNNNPLTGYELTRLVSSLSPQVVNLNVASTRVFDNIKEFIKAVSQSTILRLNISSNGFADILDGIPYIPLLESLDISYTGVSSVNSTSLEQLPGLLSLSIARNRLSEVPALAHGRLQNLDLSGNSDFLPLGTKFVIPNDVFLNLPRLETLDLSDNFIEIIAESTFAHTPRLRYLYLRNSKIHLVDVGTFRASSQLLYLDISDNDFPAIRGITPETFKGLDSLQALDLSSCNINRLSKDTFLNLQNLKFLSLRQNSFLCLGPIGLGPLLERIDLRYNYISPWDQRAFAGCRNLTAIQLRSNHLTTLTPAMVDDLVGATELDLAENPIRCDCSLFYTISPFLQLSERARLLLSTYDNSCCDGSPLTQFWKTTRNSDQCKILSPVERAAIGLGVVGIITLIAAAAFRWRWDLLYVWLQARHIFFTPALGRTAGGKEDWKYDAFISYSHRDKRFVDRIVAVLEGRFGIRVCVYDRDFAAGMLISEAVLAAVAASRTTILILSEAFVKSQWCLWEAAISQQRQLFFRRALPDSLVVVRTGPLDESLLTNTLKLLLASRIHLEWHPHSKRQRVFWHRLCEAISRTRRPSSTREKIQGVDLPAIKSPLEPDTIAGKSPIGQSNGALSINDTTSDTKAHDEVAEQYQLNEIVKANNSTMQPEDNIAVIPGSNKNGTFSANDHPLQQTSS